MKTQARIPRVYFAAAVFYTLAFAALWVHAWLTAAMLAGFVLVCISGAFFAGTNLFLPVICRGSRTANAVSLTFDDGPDPETTPALVKLLDKYRVKAAFFVTGKKAEKHPEIIRQILGSGHLIGNHTYSHDIWIMLKPAKILEAEIAKAQKIFEKSEIQPAAFRPPAGIVNPALKSILEKYRMDCVLYSCRGPDMGNRRINGLAKRIARKIRPGDIVLLHDGCPETKRFKPDVWIKEIEEILKVIEKKGFRIKSLGQLTGRPVMHTKLPDSD